MARITTVKPSGQSRERVQSYQLQSQINRQAGVLLIGATVPSFNPGDVAITFDADSVTIWSGASNGTYSTLNLSRSLSGYKALQSGTTDPTTTEFPTSGDFGFYNRTSTTELWLCYNNGGTLWGIAASTAF